MQLQQNTDRIQTTHIGSLPRPHRLLDAMKAKYSGQTYDEKAYQDALHNAVADVVREQVQSGIDIVTDGEFSKPGFFTYVRERLDGFKIASGAEAETVRAGGRRFSGILSAIFQAGDDGRGDRLARAGRVRRTGQISRRKTRAGRHCEREGRSRGRRRRQRARLPAGNCAVRRWYERILQDRRRIFSCARRRAEQRNRAIVDAGILVQIDDPFLPDIFYELGLDDAQKKRRAQIYVEAITSA